jgi:hypothetical protein
VGQTKWILDVKALESQKLVYNAAMIRPGIYNIGPLITVTKHLPDRIAAGAIQSFSLHSPVIVAHANSFDSNQKHSNESYSCPAVAAVV